MNKEKAVFALSMAVLCVAAALVATGWKEALEFKPPASRGAAPKVEAAKIQSYFSDEDDSSAFPDDRRNLFVPMLETVDLPPADLPPPPLPELRRAGPPTFPEPGYSDLSGLAEPSPAPEAGTGGREEPGKEGGTGERKRW